MDTKALPRKIERHLHALKDEAQRKVIFFRAIREFDRCGKKYVLNASLRDDLAFLHHYHALKIQRKMPHKALKHLFAAENIYKQLLKENKGSMLTWLRLARVESDSHNHKDAIRYARTAYILERKVSKRSREFLGIGDMYDKAGNHKEAERWYKKELKELGGKDPEALGRLVVFYESHREYKKGVPYALLLEKIMQRHPSYKRWLVSGKRDSALEMLIRRIGNIKAGREVR